jgi:hypothetical protein
MYPCLFGTIQFLCFKRRGWSSRCITPALHQNFVTSIERHIDVGLTIYDIFKTISNQDVSRIIAYIAWTFQEL